MAFKLADFIKETVTSPGSAAFDLNGAVSTFFPFSSYLADGDTSWYFARLGSQWEAGVGTYVAATDFLNRTTILGSSTGATITFLTGQVVITCGLPAEIMQYAVLAGAAQTLTGSQQKRARDNISAPLAGHLSGLTMSTAGGSATLSISAGDAADSTGAQLMQLPSSIAKTQSAWAAGAGGGLDTGTIANNTFYHWFLIYNPTTNACDVIFSLNAVTPALPSGFTLYRRIGAARTQSATWFGFVQVGDDFLLTNPFVETSNSAVPTAVTLLSLTVPAGPPIVGRFRCTMFNSTGAAQGMLIQSPDETPALAGSTNVMYSLLTGGTFVTAEILVRMNSSGQFRWSASLSGISSYLTTIGWTDARGRLG